MRMQVSLLAVSGARIAGGSSMPAIEPSERNRPLCPFHIFDRRSASDAVQPSSSNTTQYRQVFDFMSSSARCGNVSMVNSTNGGAGGLVLRDGSISPMISFP